MPLFRKTPWGLLDICTKNGILEPKDGRPVRAMSAKEALRSLFGVKPGNQSELGENAPMEGELSRHPVDLWSTGCLFWLVFFA
jgi:hypothetical protein